MGVMWLESIPFLRTIRDNLPVRLPFSAGLSGVYQADAETIIQNSTEENSRLHIRFPGDRIESLEIRKQK